MKIKVLFILIFSICLFGCDKDVAYYERKAELVRKQKKEEATRLRFNNFSGLITKEYDGHNYVIAYTDRGIGVCHSASCPCMKKENK